MIHPEDFCEECGRENVTWFGPSEIWNKVVRVPGERDQMLCPVCFIKRAEKAGYGPVWQVTSHHPRT